MLFHKENIISIYKDKNYSSHDVVNIIRRITGEKKVGHAGTLDPLARGILVIGIGREATKKLNTVVKKEKEYIAEIKLGWQSETDDEEGKKEKVTVSNIPSKEDISNVLSGFKGEILQRPPKFSAIKVSGTPSYKLARAGKDVDLPERKVLIRNIEILNYEWPVLKIKVITGPGVYIRSLARNIGERLKTGGYLKELERIRVGEFTKEKSLTISQFGKQWQN